MVGGNALDFFHAVADGGVGRRMEVPELECVGGRRRLLLGRSFVAPPEEGSWREEDAARYRRKTHPESARLDRSPRAKQEHQPGCGNDKRAALP